MTDADFRKLQLDYYKNNPKSGALPFEGYLTEVKRDQEIREAVIANRPKGPRSDRHRASGLQGHDHHSHGSRSARPHVSPRVGAHPKHNTPSARGVEDQHGMAGRAFEKEPLLPRQRGGLHGTSNHGREGVFEDRRPSGRFGSHHGPGRHARQAEGLHQDTMAEELGGMRLGDQGDHGHRSGPHEFGSRNGPPGDIYDESQFTSRGSRRGVREPPIYEELEDPLVEDLGGMRLGDQGHHGHRSEAHHFGSRGGPPPDTYEEPQYTSRGNRRAAREPPNREELPSRHGHHGGRSVHKADLQPLGSRRAAPAPLSSRQQTASSRPQHHHPQVEHHPRPHGGLNQQPAFQGSQGGRGGRENDYW